MTLPELFWVYLSGFSFCMGVSGMTSSYTGGHVGPAWYVSYVIFMIILYVFNTTLQNRAYRTMAEVSYLQGYKMGGLLDGVDLELQDNPGRRRFDLPDVSRGPPANNYAIASDACLEDPSSQHPYHHPQTDSMFGRSVLRSAGPLRQVSLHISSKIPQ
jgi:hypothetical protein